MIGRAALLLVPLLVACTKAPPPARTEDTPHMRAAMLGESSAIYFVLRNPGADTLVLTGVEIDVANSASIHQTMEHSGMSSMMPVDSVIVPPHDSAVFSPRGMHIMASGLRTGLVVGDTVVARLHLRPSRVDTIRVAVRE